MAADVPVLAYAAAAVPDTLGGAGVQFAPKDLEYAAELLGALAFDDGLRARRDRRPAAPAARLRRRAHRRASSPRVLGSHCREARLRHPALRRRGARRIGASLPPRRRAARRRSTTSTCSPRARATTSPGRTSIPKGPTASAASPSAASPTPARATSTRSTATRTGFSTTRTRRDDEMEWLKQQGPWCPALVDYLRAQPPAVRRPDLLHLSLRDDGARARGRAGRSILVPTAHDEPAIQLEIFKDVFSKPAAICYLTESERAFVQEHSRSAAARGRTVGVGVDIPQQQPYPRMPAPPDDDEPARRSEGRRRRGGPPREFRPHLAGARPSSAAAIALRTDGLYGGRIDPGQGLRRADRVLQRAT